MKRKLTETKEDRSNITRECSERITSIRNGSYPELQRIGEGLSKAKQRRIALADKQRKLQIRNINELYEYVLFTQCAFMIYIYRQTASYCHLE